jgi:hypothetical protein
MNRLGFLWVLMALLSATPTFAQSTFFDKGESGAGFQFGLVSHEETRGMQISITGTAGGVADMYLGFARVEKANIFTFGWAAYLYKPHRLADPIAIALAVDYELTHVRMTERYQVSRADVQLMNVGLQLYRTMYHSSGAQIEFSAGIGMYDLLSDNDTEWQPSFKFSLPMAFGDRDGTRFVISPTLNSIRYRGNYENTFGFAVGALFGSSYK